MGLGNVELTQGDAAGAEQHLTEALALFRDGGERPSASWVLTRLGDLARQGGQTAEAADLYTEGVALARRAADPMLLGRALTGSLAGLATLARSEGDLARARSLYIEGVSALRAQIPGAKDLPRSIHARCLIGLAWIEAARGQPQRAARLLGAAHALLADNGLRLDPPDAADHAAGIATVRAALDEHTFDAAFAAGRAAPLEQVQDDAPQREEPPAPALGPNATTGRRRPAGSLPQVTSRESEVAQLVAQGLSNRQIAAALHVTERTAENHVANIMNKLGFRSRVQIGTWVSEGGVNSEGRQ
jgi:non-specific serine/threonine protein kinase